MNILTLLSKKIDVQKDILANLNISFISFPQFVYFFLRVRLFFG